MRLVRALAIAILFSPCLLCAQNNAPKEPLPFNAGMLDRGIDPCADFYKFACGKWMAANPIPSDQATWGRFDELAERNREILRQILEQASVPDAKRGPVRQKIGDYYASCMDEKAVDAKGVEPLQPELARLAALRDKSELPEELAHLQRLGVDAVFRFSSDQDYKDATQVIAVADQDGLGLPERDYYFREDAKSAELRKAYVAHVQKMMELLGESPAQAASDAGIVMQMETALAKASMDVVQRREPANVYHKMAVADLAKLSPEFAWNRYLKAADAPPVQSLNVAAPDFFKGMQELLAAQPLDRWKTYLRWHLLHAAAPMLPQPFVQENFNFYGKTLTGAQELRPRWKRCVRFTDNDLGEALGQPYVEETFGVAGKERTLRMVKALEEALRSDLEQVSWMTDATKKQALIKLDKIANKIGYPDRWRDYSKLKIVRGDFLGNSLRANQFEFNRELAKIGKPVDRKEWDMSPPTVNAYYDPQMNDINFPAGILQPPFFDKRLDDAINFGAIGAVIGHELTHGFDDQGRQFDANGNWRDWWTTTDAQAFDQRAQCFVQEYSAFTPVDDVHLNGKLTLGENTADNGGLRLALMALQRELREHPDKPLDGFTPEQRLFLGWGQIWCENATPESQRMQAQTDPHSTAEPRVNGVVENMPEFQKAFGCQAGSPMVRQNACRVW
jgi:endothelin-converting enzyme/putative endopeptidase